MSQDIKSTKRIDDLFKKGQEEGLNEREKAEFLFLIEAAGLKLVSVDIGEEENVH